MMFKVAESKEKMATEEKMIGLILVAVEKHYKVKEKNRFEEIEA
jgi:hypothetical protein